MMKRLNPAHVKAVMEMINQAPYFRLLSMQMLELGLGHACLEVDLDRKHHNPFGSVHGGVIASVIDTVTFWSIYGDLDEDSGFTSLDCTVNNLSAISQGRLIATGKRIKTGRSICIAEAKVEDESGKLLAYGTSKQMVVREIQTIDHAIQSLGNPPLPPKFLVEAD